MQSPTHTAKPNTANRLAVQCRTEGDVKCRGMLKLKSQAGDTQRAWIQPWEGKKCDRPVTTLCSSTDNVWTVLPSVT